jgi:hypothetical protein
VKHHSASFWEEENEQSKQAYRHRHHYYDEHGESDGEPCECLRGLGLHKQEQLSRSILAAGT